MVIAQLIINAVYGVLSVSRNELEIPPKMYPIPSKRTLSVYKFCCPLTGSDLAYSTVRLSSDVFKNYSRTVQIEKTAAIHAGDRPLKELAINTVADNTLQTTR